MKLGGTRIFGYGVFLASILTILTAPAARYSVYALIAIRTGEGLFLVTCDLVVFIATELEKIILPFCNVKILGIWTNQSPSGFTS